MVKVHALDAPSSDSRLEEAANALTHLIALLLAVAGLVIMIVDAALAESLRALLAGIVYGLSLILLFLSSTMYHWLRHGGLRRFFLAFDHVAIFLAIAGTYTPVTLLSLPGGTAWLVFGLVWGMALTGIVLRFTWYKGFQYLSILLYLGMGWIGFAWADQLFDGLGAGGVWLIIAGGLCYSGGVVFYALRRLPFNHAIWHLCVLGGAVCHFLAVQLYAMPSVL